MSSTSSITDETVLITIMHANNEIGTIEPVEEIGAIAKERGIHFHTDTVQTVGHIPVDVNAINCDSLAISAHKLYGPKGVGAMYIRKGSRVEQFIRGGGQENNRRAGTHNVAGIVGLGKAAELAKKRMAEEAEKHHQAQRRAHRRDRVAHQGRQAQRRPREAPAEQRELLVRRASRASR